MQSPNRPTMVSIGGASSSWDIRPSAAPVVMSNARSRQAPSNSRTRAPPQRQLGADGKRPEHLWRYAEAKRLAAATSLFGRDMVRRLPTAYRACG
jgi:hypothetical protein